MCSEFARTLVKKDDKISVGLIPCAFGGTPLSSWMPGGSLNSLYSNAVIRAKEAMKSGALAGILWHQGESDAGNPELVASYAERFKTMIARLRKDLDAQKVPVIVGELGQHRGDSEQVPFNKVIHSIPDLVPNCAWASAKGCVTDGLHFKGAASYRALGESYAKSYFDIKGKMKE
ncbi:MAG: sialate O-acetylesterase [bacterium]